MSDATKPPSQAGLSRSDRAPAAQSGRFVSRGLKLLDQTKQVHDHPSLDFAVALIVSLRLVRSGLLGLMAVWRAISELQEKIPDSPPWSEEIEEIRNALAEYAAESEKAYGLIEEAREMLEPFCRRPIIDTNPNLACAAKDIARQYSFLAVSQYSVIDQAANRSSEGHTGGWLLSSGRPQAIGEEIDSYASPFPYSFATSGDLRLFLRQLVMAQHDWTAYVASVCTGVLQVMADRSVAWVVLLTDAEHQQVMRRANEDFPELEHQSNEAQKYLAEGAIPNGRTLEILCKAIVAVIGTVAEPNVST